MKRIAYLFLAFFIPISSWGQDKDLLTSDILNSSFRTLKNFIALPNNARQEGEIEANLAFLEKEFLSRGFTSKRLSHKESVILVAHRKVKAKLPTLLFYFHADGQPVDASKWDQPNPYKIVLRSKDGQELEWQRIFNRPKPAWRLLRSFNF